jgi:hypothetical protein
LRWQEASDLKIAFAWFGALRLPGLGLHGLDLIVDFVEPMLKFRRFDLHTDVATLADDVSLAGLFEFSHEERVFEATLRARDVNRFVFKHFQTSQQSCKKFVATSDSEDLSTPTLFQSAGGRQTRRNLNLLINNDNAPRREGTGRVVGSSGPVRSRVI